MSFTRPLIAVLVTLATAACATAPAANSAAASPMTARADAPNIVYIFVDDLGIGDVGAYGQDKIKTPNIDRLAREGMLFTDFYSGSTVCAPSRAVLMTGRHTGNVQIRANRELGGFRDEEERGQEPLAAEQVTVAEVLKSAGYATGGFGKWGMGMQDTEGAPHRQGFDLFVGYLDQKQAHNFYPTHLWRNAERLPLRNPWIDVHPDIPADAAVPLDAYKNYMGPDYAPKTITDAALDFISANRDRPFFVYAAFTQPHAAIQVPDEDINRFGYRGAFPETPYEAKDRGNYTPHPVPRAARAAMITRMDHDVGLLLERLESLGIADNTVVIFSSDNGASTAGGSDIDFFNATGGFRGMKRDLYEGGIRAPMVVRWPGRVAPGSRSGHISAGWDMLATFADLAGARAPATDGISMVPALTGRGTQTTHDSLYWEFFENNPAQAVRMGKWKAVRRYETQGKGKERRLGTLPTELYDLAADRGETRNLAASHPDVVARAEAVMAQRTRSYNPAWNFDPSADAE